MTQVTGRFFLDKSNPKIWRALNGFGLAVNQAADEAGVDRALLELMYVRISQINGCVYCLDVHSRAAVKAGVPADLLAHIPSWREAAAFSDQERAAFSIGEAVTELPTVDARKELLAYARQILGDDAFAVVEWAAIAMNTYNRVSIVSEHPARNPRR